MYKNPKKDGDTIMFDINNNDGKISIALINSLRRTIMSDIQIYLIDENNITFHENSSMLNNDILEKRLTLIPLNYKNVMKYDHDNLEITLNIENNDKSIISVYVSDFIVKDKSTGKNIAVEDIFTHPKILFAKLKYKQSINFTAFIIKGSTQLFGASASPVSNVSYNFEIDQKLLNEKLETIGEEFEIKIKELMDEFDKIEFVEFATTDEKEKLKKDILENLKKEKEQLISNFNINDSYRYYKRNKYGQPLVYKFTLTTIGVMSSEELFLKGLESISNILTKFSYSITNKIYEKVKFNKSVTNLNGYEIIVQYEDDTLGNLLQNYLFSKPDIKYISYNIPHPLEHCLIFKIELDKDNSEENVKKVIVKYIDSLLKELNNMSNEFSKIKFK
jgi:DNA-directed RNA polymerase subunit L